MIAWLWARTVKSPNPAFARVDVPLVSSFMLSTKAAKEAYVQPVIEGDKYRFTVRMGKPKDKEAAESGTKLGRGANFRCLMSGTPMSGDHIKSEGSAGRMSAKLMAIVAEGDRGRVYLSPTDLHETTARETVPSWRPETDLPDDPRNFWTVQYGLETYGDLFTDRQLVALNTFSDLIAEISSSVATKTRDSNLGKAVAVLLSFAISRSADRGSSICSWDSSPKMEALRNTFGRQAIPMTWDFAEGNPFSDSTGNLLFNIEWVVKVVELLPAYCAGCVLQADAASQNLSAKKVVSSDPPYYDNIGYADLSDFFYVWLRRSLRAVLPELFTTLSVPKADELVATPYRHGSKEAAEKFFLSGMTRAMHQVAVQAHEAFPATIYYAFKQAETEDVKGTSSTGWETFLAAVLEAGFSISGTWPVRTELSNKVSGIGRNMLASSIVLVCRKRPDDAPTATRREFVQALEAELGLALRTLQAGNIAPVDLAQASIGPGMAVFTRYEKVLDAEGKPLTVKQALALINEKLDQLLASQEGDFDADTRWAVAWFEQQGFAEGEYGVAETLSKAKNTSVHGMEDAGIVRAGAGKVRLLKPEELASDWDPAADARLTGWETVHQLIRVLEANGESAAADLAAMLGAKAEAARELAYRLYTICERKKRAQEALSYNGLVQSWPEIQRLAQQTATNIPQPSQSGLFS